ncbi:hypothetical protein JRO89_XS05G0241700 [Xanthoceras sorbifolium]|uniref:RING/FYVE/PHD zinc finger superfamily protein n=1 Tax=Xanthoceras sorbifolium TaxID=99658 RepID=A0ABQ8I340_9ROSI|nr:hypothetical protein JRO89_XS05G0241700 [Xanthoceras sorbifolium]
MGDHFVLLVDRLLTESTLEAAIQSQNRSMQAAAAAAVDDSKVDSYSGKVDFGGATTTTGKLVECRICQDDDEDSNMETPCSCCGSLKVSLACFLFIRILLDFCSMLTVDVYRGGAMRRGIQLVRYATSSLAPYQLEIELFVTVKLCDFQQFKPGYTAPPPLFQFGHIPMSFRGNWEISTRESNSPRIIAMVSTDRDFLHSPTFDDHSVSNSRSLLCCRSIALIVNILLLSWSALAEFATFNFSLCELFTFSSDFTLILTKTHLLLLLQFMLLLILRHTLPVILSGTNEYSFPLFTLLFLRTVGIIVPIYAIMKAVTALQRRRHQQEYYASSSFISSDEESEEHSTPQSPTHVVRFH